MASKAAGCPLEDCADVPALGSVLVPVEELEPSSRPALPAALEMLVSMVEAYNSLLEATASIEVRTPEV